MKKMVLGSIIALLFLITACAQDFALLREQEKEEMMKKQTTDVAMMDEVKKVPGMEFKKEEVVLESKRTERECVQAWEPLIAQQNPLINLEEGKIVVVFSSEISLQEALDVLETYDVVEDQIIEIFPVSKEISEEEKFSYMRRIKGLVDEGEEITVACKILQDDAVVEANPSVTLDFAKAAQAAQQQ